MNKNNSEACEIEPSSFKDPSARVFYKDGVVYRKIGKKYAETYRKFMNSGLYEKLISKGLIVPHEECGEVSDRAEISDSLNDGAEIEGEIIIKPKEVFVSYPYEWCFSELKDAALATLEIQKIALVLEYDYLCNSHGAYCHRPFSGVCSDSGYTCVWQGSAASGVLSA